MILYSLGKRIKNFVRIIIFPNRKKVDDGRGISYDEYIANKDKIREGHVTWRYDNGNLKAKCHYKDGELDGLCCYYYENGYVKAKENYKIGKREGLCKKYYQNGSILSEEYYKKGYLLFKRVFDLNGALTVEENY